MVFAQIVQLWTPASHAVGPYLDLTHRAGWGRWGTVIVEHQQFTGPRNAADHRESAVELVAARERFNEEWRFQMPTSRTLQPTASITSSLLGSITLTSVSLHTKVVMRMFDSGVRSFT